MGVFQITEVGRHPRGILVAIHMYVQKGGRHRMHAAKINWSAKLLKPEFLLQLALLAPTTFVVVVWRVRWGIRLGWRAWRRGRGSMLLFAGRSAACGRDV